MFKNKYDNFSVRTKFGCVTGIIILLLLLSFYVGGRYVLIYMMREVDKEVQLVSTDVKHLVNSDFSSICMAAGLAAQQLKQSQPSQDFTDLQALDEAVQQLLVPNGGKFSFALVLRDPGAKALSGWFVQPHTAVLRRVQFEDLAMYQEEIPALRRKLARQLCPVGMMKLFGSTLLMTATPLEQMPDGRPRTYVILGTHFNRYHIMEFLSQHAGGIQVTLTDTFTPIKTRVKVADIAPVFTETQNFYAGGTWHIGENNFEAVLPIHDIRGNIISTISIQTPQSFTSIAEVALGWLTAFIATVGIIFVFPIFWIHAKVFLNPLTRLSHKIQSIDRQLAAQQFADIDWPTEDEFGVVAQNVNHMLETISRKNAQIQQNELNLRTIFACIPDGLCIFDRQGCLVRVRKQPDDVIPIPGIKEGQTIGASGYYLLEDVTAFKAIFEQVFTSGKMCKGILHAADKHLVHVYEVRIKRMDTFFALVVFRDVSEEVTEHRQRVQMELRLAQSARQESLMTLSAGIAHDINNILAIILSTLEAALADAANALPTSAIDIIRDAVSRGSTMARELMTYAGEVHFVFQRENPNAYIHAIEHLFNGVLSPQHTLSYDLAEDLPDVMIDPEQLWKVFINLLKNASESMADKKGEIQIATYAYTMTAVDLPNFFSTHSLKPGPGVIFKFSDTGQGIPLHIQQHLFEPFVSTKSPSRGFGMATVLALVDAHGGAISLHSEAQQGTIFYVWLPSLEHENLLLPNPPPPRALTSDNNEALQAHPETPSTKTTAQTALKTFACLLIDDDATILTSTKLLLETVFHAKVFTAQTKHEALSIFRTNSNTIDVIFQDAFLASIDTVRLIRPLRMCRDDIPIIIVSGLTQERIQAMFQGQSYEGYLSKPFTLADLRALLAKLVPSSLN